MMQSSSVRKPRVSRKRLIPEDLTSKWQSSRPGDARPLVRRPKTACQSCRTAKVKCHGDGQRECSRCIRRGVSCHYTEEVCSSECLELSSGSMGEIQTKTNERPTQQLGSNNVAHHLLAEATGSWSDMHDLSFSGGTEQHNIEWDTADPILDWPPQMGTGLSSSMALPNTSLISSNNPNITNDCVLTSGEPCSLSSLGLFPLIDSTSAAGLSWQNQLSSQACQCRTGLALLIPDAKAALKERQLDNVCQVTGDVIRQCRSIVSCNDCNVNCTDLICIMAVFQEVDLCFEYIAKGDIEEPISVSMGSYAMSVDEQDVRHYRRMLVTPLVRRANELLDLISGIGQDMLKNLSPDCRLGRVNIAYLEAVIANSRDNFHRILEELPSMTGVVN